LPKFAQLKINQMKKLMLTVALLSFVGGATMSAHGDDKDKKNCKDKKECCKKDGKSCCKKGEKKAESKPAEEKK
jgi:hypothetical protein